MIKYAILDDEPIAHRIIDGFAKNLSQLSKVGSCYNAFEAIELLQKQSVDVLFLDIKMPELSGFDFLKTLPSPPKVIVTSAHKEFALEGYELNIEDYLLKPFSFDRFLKAVNKIIIAAKPRQDSIMREEIDYIYIKSDKKQFRVQLDEILFIEAYGNYCKVTKSDGILTTLKKISDFELILPETFIRIHNSFIVSKRKITAIEGNSIYIGSHKIPVGSTYRSLIGKLYE